MSLLITLVLGALWLPVDSGPEAPSLALTLGGDGRLYSAQAGQLMQRGADGWRSVAQYAPSLTWDGDEINADGPFSRERLYEVTQRAEAALESKGLELGSFFEQELVDNLLFEIVSEMDPASDSFYRVYDIAPAPGGVWLATGRGLFRPGEPPRLFGRVFSLAVGADRLYFTTPEGLFELPEGATAPLLLEEGAEIIARRGAELLFLKEGQLGSVNGAAPEAPTLLTHLAAAGALAWGVGDGQLWRLEGSSWRSCGEVPAPISRLRASERGLILVTEGGVYTTALDCAAIKPAPRSWIGQVRFTDAVFEGATLWAATSHGLLQRTTTREANLIRLKDFKREVATMPSLYEMVQAALRHQALDRESGSYGSRPLWRYALPSVRAAFSWDASRQDENPTLVRGSERLNIYPGRFDYLVFAEWDLDLGAFAPQSVEQQWTQEQMGLNVAVEQPIVDDNEEELVLFAVEDTPTIDQVDVDALIALQSSQLNRDRRRVTDRVRTLYRERARLLSQLWLSEGGRQIVHIEPNEVGEEAGLSPNALLTLCPPEWDVALVGEALESPRVELLEAITTHTINGRPLRHWATVSQQPQLRREAVEWTLRKDEIDALLDAATGGAWSEALHPNRGG